VTAPRGGDEGGVPRVRGVRVVRLVPGRPLRVEITPASAILADPQIEAEWTRKKAINPRFFDAPILSVREVDAASGVIRCALDSYKRLVVQPEVETGVQQLSVTGVLTARDSHGVKRVLLGRRSHKTRMYGGMWQNCPAGGIDPPGGGAAASTLDQQALIAELLREVKEESGLEPKAIADPIAIIFDETARSHDIIIPVDMGQLADLSTTRGWEYDELRWMDRRDFLALEHEDRGGIMAITRAAFRLVM
jgi:8-oxo-dGTP pyrophosphatase MutT (NUDIX family)